MVLIPGITNALPYATSTAKITWDLGSQEPGSLKIEADGLTINYLPDKYGSLSKAKVWSENPDANFRDRERVESWSNTEANKSINGASAHAHTSNEELYEEVSAKVVSPDSQRWAQARADRWVYFEAIGKGTITLTADYRMYQDIRGLATENDWLYADSEVWLELHNKNTDVTEWDWRWIERELWGPADPETNEETGSLNVLDGILNVSLDFNDGDRGYMWMGVYNEVWAYNGESAPVPEPATMLLLGSGLVGLAGFRRKFRKA